MEFIMNRSVKLILVLLPLFAVSLKAMDAKLEKTSPKVTAPTGSLRELRAFEDSTARSRKCNKKEQGWNDWLKVKAAGLLGNQLFVTITAGAIAALVTKPILASMGSVNANKANICNNTSMNYALPTGTEAQPASSSAPQPAPSTSSSGPAAATVASAIQSPNVIVQGNNNAVTSTVTQPTNAAQTIIAGLGTAVATTGIIVHRRLRKHSSITREASNSTSPRSNSQRNNSPSSSNIPQQALPNGFIQQINLPQMSSSSSGQSGQPAITVNVNIHSPNVTTIINGAGLAVSTTTS